MMEYLQILDSKLDSLDLVMVIESACLDRLVFPIMPTLECRVVINI